MAIITFREALGAAMAEEMARDDKVFLLGEEVAEYDGAYKVSKGLLAKFGAKRVIDAPISEAGFAGLGIGAAMAGLRPIIEFMTWNFAIQAFDQIINNSAKINYMSGGQFAMPIVYRGPNGAAHMLGAQHSQNLDPLLTNIPGLKVVAVSTPKDAKGLLKAAIRDNNPVAFLESEMLYGMKGKVPDEEFIIPLGTADIKKTGCDVTIISWGKTLHKALDASSLLYKDLQINAEVIDIRTIVPLDIKVILASVAKTNRVVIVEENWPFASVGAEIASQIQREAFDDLDAPILRVSQEPVPVPYNERLEATSLPSIEAIVTAVKTVTYRN